jgi:hypothetical protein
MMRIDLFFSALFITVFCASCFKLTEPVAPTFLKPDRTSLGFHAKTPLSDRLSFLGYNFTSVSDSIKAEYSLASNSSAETPYMNAFGNYAVYNGKWVTAVSTGPSSVGFYSILDGSSLGVIFSSTSFLLSNSAVGAHLFTLEFTAGKYFFAVRNIGTNAIIDSFTVPFTTDRFYAAGKGNTVVFRGGTSDIGKVFRMRISPTGIIDRSFTTHTLGSFSLSNNFVWAYDGSYAILDNTILFDSLVNYRGRFTPAAGKTFSAFLPDNNYFGYYTVTDQSIIYRNLQNDEIISDQPFVDDGSYNSAVSAVCIKTTQGNYAAVNIYNQLDSSRRMQLYSLK